MFCIKCGTALPKEAGFCPKCGNAIAKEGSTEVPLNIPNTAQTKAIPDSGATKPPTVGAVPSNSTCSEPIKVNFLPPQADVVVEASEPDIMTTRIFFSKYKTAIIIIMAVCLACFTVFGVVLSSILKEAETTNGASATVEVTSDDAIVADNTPIVTESDEDSSDEPIDTSAGATDGVTQTVTFPDGIYVGTMSAGLKEGSGEFTYTNGDKYIGQYKADKPNGAGQIFYADGSVFNGSFINGKREGAGRINFADASVFEGNFINDLKDGAGSFHYATGEIYIGSYVADKKSGDGTYYFANGDQYKGEFQNDLFNGYGEYTSANQSSNFKGNWINGVKQS